MVGLFLLAGFFGFFGAVSSWWLAFGYTQLVSDGHEVVLRFVGNYLFRHEYRYKRGDFAMLCVDPRWRSATSIPVLAGYGFIPFFGPLCFRTWDGYSVHIGGNLSPAEADRIAGAVSQFAEPQPRLADSPNKGIERTATR